MPLPLLIPGIIAGVSALAGVGSSLAAGGAASSAERQLRERREADERRYLHESNTDFLDTETAKSTLSVLRKNNKKQLEAADNNAVKQGISEEAQVALAGRLNEGYADSASRLAGFGTQYQQQIKENYLRRVGSTDDMIYNSQLRKADALGGLIDSIGGLAGAGLMAYGSGAFEKTPKADMKLELA